jgi:DNA-binding LacI/PurR family transcriptional regulator
MHRMIYEQLLHEIQSGVYQVGDRLPSEALLCERFKASRITVARAIHTLQRERLVSRRPGSGTYVERPQTRAALNFGLLIPELGSTEIYEPICQGMMRSPLAKSHSLTWGNSGGSSAEPEKAAEELCQQYIAQKVAGVFFAPMDAGPTRDRTNRGIAAALARARIPTVLLDRCFEPYPERSPFDLVGIDNFRAGYELARHLLKQGARRLLFAVPPLSASSVDGRIAGFHHALATLRNDAQGKVIWGAEYDDAPSLSAMLEREQPDGILCANDLTAARVMQTLLRLGVCVPAQVRVVGIDDVNYARFLPVPLTTIRQDCAEIGSQAIATMLDRIERPRHAPADVRVGFDLIVRRSCGAAPADESEPKPPRP